MKMSENFAALVKVNKISLIAQKDTNKISVFEFESFDSDYSRVAIFPDGIMFNVTMLVSPDEKREFLLTSNDLSSLLTIEIDFSLMTDKYVTSHLICRSTLICKNYSEKELIYNDFQIDDRFPPVCFWKGNEIIGKKTIKTKLSKRE
jgi:hypothetical protein